MSIGRRIWRVARWALLALALLIFVLNWTWARPPKEPQPAGQFATVAGHKIHYVEHPGAGPTAQTVVLLHGQPGTIGDWERVVPLLKNYRVIAVDRPGYGHSGSGVPDLAEQADVLHGLLIRLKATPAIVVGHSWGGAMSMAIASRHPADVSELVLVGTAGGDFRRSRKVLMQARMTGFLEAPGVRQIANATFANTMRKAVATPDLKLAFDPLPLDPGYQKRFLALTLRHSDMVSLTNERYATSDGLKWLSGQYPRINQRAVVIHGRGDNLIAFKYARDLAKKLPNASFALVSGGHMITYAHPQLIAQSVQQAANRAAAEKR